MDGDDVPVRRVEVNDVRLGGVAFVAINLVYP